LDIWQLLVESYNPAIPQDVIDHTRGVTPSSLRYDPLHFNGAGNAKIAQFLKSYLIDYKGY
jgi:lysophospholipase L1-like esterase